MGLIGFVVQIGLPTIKISHDFESIMYKIDKVKWCLNSIGKIRLFIF